MSTETISITVVTHREGVAHSTLTAKLEHRDGQDQAEVIYVDPDASFALAGPDALAFLTLIARDATTWLTPRPPVSVDTQHPSQPQNKVSV